MNEFTMLEFFNPIKKRPVFIRSGSICGCDYDAANKVNIIYVPGGMFPVEESLDQIKEKVEQLNLSQRQTKTKGAKNGT